MKMISRVLFTGLLLAMTTMASGQFPVVAVRFANPQYHGSTQIYTVDVEFQCNVPGKVLYGMNVRFFYDDYLLEFLSMGNFIPGYSATIPMPPVIMQSAPSGGAALFGLPSNHPFEFFNGAIQLTDSTNIPISMTEWTRIFSVSFHVDDLSALNDPDGFCPSLIWDLEANPVNGGWLNGDDGVVITLQAPPPLFSGPSTEQVIQFNWQYNTVAGTVPYGFPVSSTCLAPGVPAQITITGVIPQGQSSCYNATQTLTIAGNGSQLVIQSGASVTMIAGQSIRYLPGTKVLSGGYMHGYITPDGQYCGYQAPTIPNTITGNELIKTDAKDPLFVIYPNPAFSYFTIERVAGNPVKMAEIQIQGMHGEKLMSEKVVDFTKETFDISSLPDGMYFVRVIAGGKTETFKLIKLK